MKDKEYIDVEVEIVDANGDILDEPKSAVEQLTNVSGYNELVRKINEIEYAEFTAPGDGKSVDKDVCQIIWRDVIMTTKPMVARNEYEKTKIESIYKLLYAFTKGGNYPSTSNLTNYLGIDLDELFRVISDTRHRDYMVYNWAYKVFKAAAEENSIKSNGNIVYRQWLDKSREYQVAAEDAIRLTNEINKIDTLRNIGKELALELIGDNRDD
jgi:hypothetical protein